MLSNDMSRGRKERGLELGCDEQSEDKKVVSYKVGIYIAVASLLVRLSPPSS